MNVKHLIDKLSEEEKINEILTEILLELNNDIQGIYNIFTAYRKRMDEKNDVLHQKINNVSKNLDVVALFTQTPMEK